MGVIHPMELAFQEANKAKLKNEVPVGAVIFCEGQLISKAHNLREKLPSVLGHAELMALHRASKKIGSWRLEECEIYITLEPCSMCLEALKQARIKKIYFAARDDQKNLYKDYSPKTEQLLNYTSQGENLLKEFFSDLRKNEFPTPTPRKVSVGIIFHKERFLNILVKDPTTKEKKFFFPGGKIEDNESPIETCTREIFEETGYKVKLWPESHFYKEFNYVWNGITYHRMADYYIGTLDQDFKLPEKQLDANYNLGPQWLSIEECTKANQHHPALTGIFQKAIKFISKKKQQKQIPEKSLGTFE